MWLGARIIKITNRFFGIPIVYAIICTICILCTVVLDAVFVLDAIFVEDLFVGGGSDF